MTWLPRFPSRRARAALKALSQPSIPTPLRGSHAVGPDQWWSPASAEKVITAYTRTKANVPATATVEHLTATTAVVRSSIRDCGIVASPRPSGCVYTIATRPTLDIQGGKKLPDWSGFIHVGSVPMDTTGLGFIAEAPTPDGPWVVMVSAPEDDDTETVSQGPVPESAPMQLLLLPGTLSDITDQPGKGALAGPCTAVRDGEWVVANATLGRSKVLIRARTTDPGAAMLPQPRARIEISKKWGRPRSRPTISGEGFDPVERIGLTLSERKLTGTTADDSGSFSKGFTVPDDIPTGQVTITATGSRSKKSDTVDFEIRPPR